MPVTIDPPRKTSTKTPAGNVRRGSPGRPSGLGDAAITVKGKRATAKQRTVLAAVLREAKDQNSSRRVMVATVMCVTQESNAGVDDLHGGGTDDIGPFNQGREWISVTASKSPAKATRAFLLGGAADVGGTEHSKKGWKQHFGSLKNAPGGLAQLIHQVQGNARASDYAPWEAEATKTVQAFMGGALGATGTGGRTYTSQYLYERGTRDGERESSWDCSAKLAEEVNARRWAALNTLNYATEDELAAAAPSLQIDGDEEWLLGRPSWQWAVDRPIADLTYRVLSERWGILPGAVVIVANQGAFDGRYLVLSVTDDLFSPESDVVLRRPIEALLEPRSETRTSDAATGDDVPGATQDGDLATRLRQACQHISDQHRAYFYGGGHGPALGSIGPGLALDCSSSCSLALFRVDAFGKRTTAIVSGEFASSYGKPGKGEKWTVWANGEHVWIEFADGARFDTSPQGDDSGSGPRLRLKKRSDQSRFTPRHLAGN